MGGVDQSQLPIIATGHGLAQFKESHPEIPSAEIAFQGLVESTNNLALGFTVLALVHLALAVGARREALKGA